MIEEGVEEGKDLFGVLDYAGCLKPAVDEGEYFDNFNGGEFVNWDSFELFMNGGIDYDKVMEVLLVCC